MATREQMPLRWAQAQENLGIALLKLGEREDGTEPLEQAVAALRASLEERTRERSPFGWAETQMYLGEALRSMGEREGGSQARLKEAVEACDAAVTVFEEGHVDYYIGKARDGRAHAEALLQKQQGGPG